jgi:hypothetical protein
VTSPQLVDEKPVAQSEAIRAIDVDARRSGPAAAVVLAAGISCFALGLVSVLAEASGFVSDALTLSDPVGPVSGLSTVTTAAFFLAWGSLAIVWRRGDPSLGRVATVSGVLVCLGLLGTFPPILDALGG